MEMIFGKLSVLRNSCQVPRKPRIRDAVYFWTTAKSRGEKPKHAI